MISNLNNDFNRRFNIYKDELLNNYKSLYGNDERFEEKFTSLIESMEKAFINRKPSLRTLDIQRENDSSWFLSQKQVGYMLYLDLFCKDLKGLRSKINYLKELKITYLHIMPLLKMPKEHNDGGYAVSSYEEIDNRFGNMDEFEKILDMFRDAGISVCLDFVINHTSKEHKWALKAKKGISEYENMYFIYDTDEIPNEFEKTVPEVFPKVSPGNFTYYADMDKYVMTSFYEFQWDLNYHNPVVFNEIAKSILNLANRGVEIFRLDAIPFMWKELGTTCRNLPEIHTLVETYKLIAKIVCPGVIFKGEAIVAPDEILSYFGGLEGKECNTMYNASFMVLLWNSIATKDTGVMIETLKQSPTIPKEATWINYIRCHDDIGWGFEENILKQFNFDPFSHKQFMINFFRGDFYGSFAKGELYEFDETTLDARNSGTLASLCGLEKALLNKDKYQQELAEKRIAMLHKIILAYSGIPVLYSGDELAQLNDWNYLNIKNKCGDSRWLHRPSFNWEKAKNRNNLGTIAGRTFTEIKNAIDTRGKHNIFRSDILSTPFYTSEKSIFSFKKRSHNEELLVLSNFSENPVYVKTQELFKEGFFEQLTDLLQGKVVDLTEEKILVGPYECLWLYKSF